ncbi:amino acid adenylation domain-containing protein [Streptomyces sp. NPDC048182]|uniref:non-ribosomal peptide synthetase family protein n=1 Tax=Streptomyces sp. NPDC048182 TaxID=3365507 RepID=UPI0037181FEB
MSETATPTAPTERTPATVIGRWTTPGPAPAPGTGQVSVPVPEELARAVRDLAAAEGVAPQAVLLAAHLKVIAALASEREIVTGLRPRPGAPAARCHAVLADGPWRAVLATAQAAVTAAEAAPGAAESSDDPAETLLDLGAPHGGPDPDDTPEPHVVLRVAHVTGADGPSLRVTHRQEALRRDFAERVAGYQLTALRLLTADPDAGHHEQSLLTAEEAAYQRDALAGPQHPLSESTFAELFQAQVARVPDAVAAVHGDRAWTYAVLNRRANRIAHRLLAAGLAPQDVVAVAADRTLEWLSAVLGVLKAGGAYLPVRPDFPAARVATQLERSDCRFAIAEPAARALLHTAAKEAGRDCAILLTESESDAGTGSGTVADTDPGLPLAPDHLAYVYFTSGSTGTPKGAMCEHAGMLNHLAMKIEDMDVRAGDTVTQTASQCFDISLWQLVAPLLVGGTTEIIDTGVQLDVGRFVDRIAAGGVHVVQVVPSYLDVLLTHLERHPRPLGDLKTLAVTGEALRDELVRRWFALHPGITLVNCYGATEVCDDTMHGILHAPPVRDFVTVGTSRRNVATYVVDEQLRLVPLGAPGEIVFSGVSVGRGYINDPERTARAFTADPHRPGSRLYRTGDFGRWLPEGEIEYLGRRDEQVKIRGYRIEIGEIENRLTCMPSVGQAAVVIESHPGGGRSLTAFYADHDTATPADPVEAADLRDFLAASLPDYMIPSYFHRVDRLPLNENGKIDKLRLTARAARLRQEADAYEPLATPTERRLAALWAETLGIPVGRIGRGDDFFRHGGTSLSAVRMLVGLDRAVSLRRLMAGPTLREVAAAVDEHTGAADTPKDGDEGHLPLLQPLPGPAHPRATLVCFPYAGGNAVNFQGLAAALAPEGVTVLAAEPPGHDVARPGEALIGPEETARRALRDLAPADGPVLVWGQCAGAAPALALARALEEAGRPAAGLLLAAALLDDPAGLREEAAGIAALTDQRIVALLHDDTAYVELDLLKDERAGVLGRAYRHDVVTAHHYLAALQEGAAPPLRTPVVVITAADDPGIPEDRARAHGWDRVAAATLHHRLDHGGHSFPRTAPEHAAEPVLKALAGLPAPAAHGTGRRSA